jgi:isoleucyl-tRNA synthetase
MFEQESQNLSFPSREEDVLAFWKREKIFEKSVSQREGSPLFSFYDGPPFATGLPHYGHILAGTIKDAVLRYWTMKGFYLPRRFGWDCHGLPVENEIEKAKELSGASAIENFGIAAFNEECRKIVLRYTSEWERTVDRMGRWVDFKNSYLTMDKPFMESVWWVFSQLYSKGLVYEGFKVMPFSAKLGTPLSNFEANLNYRDVDDPSLSILFTLSEEPDTQFLVWTTTPWTLPMNLALVVKGDLDYVKVRDQSGKRVILAQSRMHEYFKDPAQVVIEETFKGETLKGKPYEPLFPYFASKKQQKAFHVLVDDCVSSEEGTGILHAAPAFGEEDFFVCTREGIEVVCPVDHNGRYTREVPDYEGIYVKDADKEIIKRLKAEKKVFHQGTIRHRYPFCWRSDTPLIYKAVKTWFVSVEKIKQELLAANKNIHWVPEHIQDGRFGKWLENARDWAVSRNRYWGTPIPIWRNDQGECIVISSVEELEKRTGKKIEDLHRHHIDDLTFEENGKTYKRISEVFDCWFESGSMPYAQNHFPFEKQESFMQGFPADFIAEGLDQTRGWFYTLTVLSVALFHKPAFKHVIVNGIILAEDGNKMSKRLKNYPEPDLIFNQHGADALRLYLLNSPAVHAEDLRFSERGVELVMRQVLIPLWNSYHFLATYANIYKWKPNKEAKLPQADIDRWILSVLQKLTEEVGAAMNEYLLGKAVQPFVDFIEGLTNWYIRRCRTRFWSDVASQDRDEAFQTLYTVLLTVSKIAAPFVPFISDAIYLRLKQDKDPLSAHLCDFPVPNAAFRDEKLEKEMASVQTVVNLGHSLRKEHKMKVRQPLAKAHVLCADTEILDSLKKQQGLIADELNVKDVEFLADETTFVKLAAKANFRVLGKKVGPLMKAVQKAIEELDQRSLKTLFEGRDLPLEIENQKIVLTSEDIAVERKVREGLVAQTSAGITVALDTALTEPLLVEGMARELINKINTMRRDEGYEVTDRIVVKIQTTERVKSCFEAFKESIMHEVLATDVQFVQCEGTSWDLNGEPSTIQLIKS